MANPSTLRYQKNAPGRPPRLALVYARWPPFCPLPSVNRQLAQLANQAEIWLHHYHGTGGGGPVTRGTIQTNRLAVMHPDAHIVLTGHTHDEWCMPIPRQRVNRFGRPYHDEQLHIRVPGYKDAWGDGDNGWEVERMLGPKNLGAAWLHVRCYRDGDNREVEIEARRAK